MASTATTRLRLEKQALGENSATWGAPKLNTVLDLVDEAIGGVESIAIAGTTTTLTSTNYASDQSRNAALVLTGTLSAASSVVVPNVEKLYLVINNTTMGAYTLTIKTAAGTGYSLRSGPNWVYCDATNVSGAVPRLDQLPLATASVDLNSQRITALGTPTASTDAATKAYVDAAVSTTPTQNLATSAGTALAPTYSWATDSNTGMYLVGSDSLGLSAGGTVRATVSSTGLAVAGVFSASGTMTASGGLGVTGALATTGAASIGSTLGVTGAATLGSTLGVTGATTLGSTCAVTGALTAASVASSGAVSGTTLAASGAATLSSTLGVTGAATLSSTLGVTGAVTASSTITSAGVILGPAGSVSAPSHSFSTDTNTGMYSGGADELRFATGGTDRLKILTAGDVGIGGTTTTSADTRYLTIKGPNSGSGYASLRVEGGTTTKQGMFQVSGSAGDVVLGTDAISNTTGALGLYAGGAVRQFIAANGTTRYNQTATDTPGYSGDSAVLGVGIGFNGTSGRVFISQDAFSNWTMNTTGTLVAFNQGATGVGSITISGSTTSYNTSSDYRLKTSVEPLTGAVTRIAGLKPSRFRFKTEAPTAPKIDGFLAHEVSGAVPEAVSGVKDGPMMQQLDLSKIVPLLVGAVQELAVRLAAAEADIKTKKDK